VPLALLDTPRWTLATVARVGLAVAVFTLASALVYLLNDVFDRHRDRRHPTKRHRPVAAGRVSVPAALALACVLCVPLILALTAAPPAQWWPVPVYLAVNAAYSQGLKHVPLVDVFIVAAGFVLRLVQGYLAAGTRPSGWLVLCVFALCLLLVLGKRRHEMNVGGSGHRPSLQGYSFPLLDQLIGLTATLTAISYVLYLYGEVPISSAAPFVAFLSAPCALFGIARYLQVVFVEQGGGNPVHALFRDRVTVVNATVWAALLGTTFVVSHS
jgi:4-hydroxybenzoate polyprenyltransferase